MLRLSQLQYYLSFFFQNFCFNCIENIELNLA